MNDNDPALARRYGAILMVVATIAGLLYALALMRRSYAALAVPVTAGVGVVLTLAMVLGRLLLTTPDEPHDF